MYLSQDVAKSDFVLAAAVLFIGPIAIALVVFPLEQLLGQPIANDPWVLLATIVLVAVAFPRWLVRQRGDGLAAFSLEGPPSQLTPGLALGVPVFAAWLLTQWAPFGPDAGSMTLVDALLGRLAPGFAPNPTVGEATGPGLSEILFQAASILVLFVASAAVWSFLIGRARRGFDSPDRSVTQALRTYGMIAAGTALVIGGLWSLVSDFGRPVVVLANVVVLVLVILLADRLIGLAPTATRATFVGPIIVLAVLQVRGGGIDLGFNAYAAALSAGHLVVFASLIEARKTTWAALPMLLASAWIPGCSGLLYWGTSLGNPGC